MTHSQCPLCKTEQFESNLKRVILLEEIVASYAALRPQLLELLASGTPEIVSYPDESSASKRGLSAEVIDLLSDSEAETPAAKRPKTAPEDSVACPICQEPMAAEYLQTTHLDECLSGKKRPSPTPKPPLKKKPQGISSFFQKRPLAKPKMDHENFYFNEATKHHHEDSKKLPKLDFSSLATPKLKEKLAAVKVPATGTRHQLELRYNQYYILHNANLDSSHPVPGKVLQQRLSQWEAGHLAFSTSSTSLFGSRGSISNKSITDNDFLVALWMQTYKDEFRVLVRAAKKSLKRPAAAETNAENDNTIPAGAEPDDSATENNGKTDTPASVPLQNTVSTGTNAGDGNSGAASEGSDFDFSTSSLFTPAQ